MPCDRPTFEAPRPPTWRDVAELAVARGAALAECNERLELLRIEYSD